MCGILAFHTADRAKHIDRDLIESAANLMSHRGPDSAGISVLASVALAHRRLSIIDLASGQQPMFSESGSIGLVFNGEIYNYREIQEELIAKGYRFQTNSDTEVIISAYEEWGTESVLRFNGMFAFALWDAPAGKLWVVRDRLGIKPLYYTWDGQDFACASEIKPLLRLGGGRTQINEAVLDAYFTVGYVPAPQTLFKGILKLAPGHSLMIDGATLREDCYWDFAQIEPQEMGLKEAASRVDELFRDCVGKCLVSDVPLGAFLSGGLDSSAVVAAMHDLHVAPIDTFTVSYGSAYKESEESYAQAVADHFGTRHHLLNLEPDDFLASIRTLVSHCEEPIVEAASIALFRLSVRARQDVKVLLSGEGADELFAGYGLYSSMPRVERLRCLLPSLVTRGMQRALKGTSDPRWRKYADWLGLGLQQRYRGISGYLGDSARRGIYTRDFYESRGSYLDEAFGQHFERVRHQRDPLSQMLYVDTKTWLSDNLLLKADKMTMAASVELRVPFLDHRLVEFAAALPSHVKTRGGAGKIVLKEAMASRLPASIRKRKKMGFPVPVAGWFSGTLAPQIRATLCESTALPWLDRQALDRMLAEHQDGIANHSRFLLTALILCEWQLQYL